MGAELDGIIVLDKPAGISSAKTVAEVKRLLGAEKCGHAGTLDPFATGVLICCINQATRLARFFLHGEKEYRAVLRLGTTTDTQDFTGSTIDIMPVPELSERELREIFISFKGMQMQQPPAFAALKHEGTPLYKLARQGKPVQKMPRPVAIRRIRIVEIQLPDITFEVTCSAGTYIRTVCADIGRRIGCGGHLAQLCRVASCGFTLKESITLAELRARPEDTTDNRQYPAPVIPMAEALRGMPVFKADDHMLEHIRHGRKLSQTMIPADSVGQESANRNSAYNEHDEKNEYIKVINSQGQLAAVIQRIPDDPWYNYCCVFH